MTASHPLYDRPELHDLAFSGTAAAEVAFYEAVFRKRQARRVLEVGCGSGRILARLHRRGFDVVGVDWNLRMLAELKARAPEAVTIRADMRSFRVRPPVDGAFCALDTFRHLVTDEDVERHLECMAGVLRAGAPYLVDLWLFGPDYRYPHFLEWTAEDARMRVEARWGPDGAPDGGVVVEEGTFRVLVKDREEIVRTREVLRAWSRKGFEGLVRRSGFRVEAWHDEAFDPRRRAPAGDRTARRVAILVR